MTDFDLDFAYSAGSAPPAQGIFKQQPEDFVVSEVLGFEPEQDDKAQHHWLWVKKRGANTEFVARQIARFAQVPLKEVGFSGMKDRQALTYQWYSVQLPATREIDWQALQHAEFSIERNLRCARKLRRGAHRFNDFTIRLRDVSDPQSVEQRLQQVAAQGVANYFGSQRFGRQGANLDKAQQMFAGRRIKDRNLRSIVLSSARSYLFNQVLSERIQAGLLTQLVAGDVMILSGSQSYFVADEITTDTQSRWQQGDIVISAPLWGRGQPLSSGRCAEMEQRALAGYAEFTAGLEQAGLKQERRAAVLRPANFEWEWQASDLVLHMRLPSGTFATSVLRDIIQLQEGLHENSAKQ